MSRFSGLDSQSSALIGLERQRLEAKIGQLRREVESPNDLGYPRRLEKKVPAKGQRIKATSTQTKPNSHQVAFPPRSAEAKDKAKKPPKLEQTEDDTRAPSPDGEDDATPSSPSQPGSAGPSVEIAWLMQISEIMEAEGAEAKAFLAKHGLDRYSALLSEKGLDSIKALRHASETDLAEVGLPEATRVKLMEAIATLPPEMQPEPAVGVAAPEATNWHRFGKAPPGWRSMESSLPAHEAVKVHAISVGTSEDAACGGDDPIEPSWLLGEPDLDPEPLWPLRDGADCEVSVPDSDTDASQVRFFNVEEQARLQSVSLVSASSCTALAPVVEEIEKVCCYGCFKQVYPSQAITVEDPVICGPRFFCTDACASSFRKEIEKRAAREAQRNSLWQTVPDVEECSRPGSAASKAATATEIAIGRSLTALNEVPDFEPSSRPGSSANIAAHAAANALGRPLSAAFNGRPPSGMSRPPSSAAH